MKAAHVAVFCGREVRAAESRSLAEGHRVPSAGAASAGPSRSSAANAAALCGPSARRPHRWEQRLAQ